VKIIEIEISEIRTRLIAENIYVNKNFQYATSRLRFTSRINKNYIYNVEISLANTLEFLIRCRPENRVL